MVFTVRAECYKKHLPPSFPSKHNATLCAGVWSFNFSDIVFGVEPGSLSCEAALFFFTASTQRTNELTPQSIRRNPD